MVILVIGADPWVHPVSRAQILDQIVGAHADEIHLFRHPVGDQSNGRDLHHNADGDGMIPRDSLGVQLFAFGLDDGLGGVYFVQGAHHRHHDLQLSVGGSPQRRPDLGAEQLRLGKGKP